MRMFLAILACKVSKCLLKLIGRGSSLPGDIALKICPDVLLRVKLPQQVIAVTGSNGKDDNKEGVHYGNFYGTHLIVPLLIRNPQLCEYFADMLGK